MGVKRDNVPFAGGERGGRSPPKEVAKEAKRTFAAGLDLLTLKQENVTPEHKTKQRQRSDLCDRSGLTDTQTGKHRQSARAE